MKELSMIKALYTLLALSLTSPAFSQAPGPQVQVELKIIEIDEKDYDELMAELKAAKGAPASAKAEKRRHLGHHLCGLWQSEEGWKVRPLHPLVFKCNR
jgi:hypothetical protein